MTKPSPAYARMRRDRVRSAPAATKRCKRCRRSLPLTSFEPRPKGGQGVVAVCSECLEERYQTETFTCRRCGETKPATEFFRASGGAIIRHPCRACRTEAAQENTRLRHIKQGREPYHILSNIDPESRRADCRECGPTHIYATGAKTGRGWRCGIRSDQLSDETYSKREDIVGLGRASTWHRIRDVRGDEMRGTCSQCGDVPVRWENSKRLFICVSPARRRKHADEVRSQRRLAQYGLTDEAYDELLAEQKGVCAICRGVNEANGWAAARADSDVSLVIDHDHTKSGPESVRGLLCGFCNSGLGHFFDNPDLLAAAIVYLTAYAEKARAA